MTTIKEFIESFEGTVDVHDNYCEELAVAYCGEKLTPEGEKHFSEALELPVIETRDDVIIIGVDMPELTKKQIENRLRLAKDLFESIAGMCGSSDYDKWFKSED